jgi:hypothetical protein
MKTYLRIVLPLAILLLVAGAVMAQSDKSKRPSPPAQAKSQIGDVSIIIDYSTPAVRGREVWGALVPYGKVWRTGANEATIFEISGDLEVQGKTLPAGKYGLFTIPNEDEWVVIFNSDWEQWGHFNYDSTKDILRVAATPEKSDTFMERMTFTIDDGHVHLQWGDLTLPIAVAAK